MVAVGWASGRVHDRHDSRKESRSFANLGPHGRLFLGSFVKKKMRLQCTI